ncbi:MAG: intradiol ring-cleavage dioxygenase [Burkholderiaceae bacterium]|jgi:protocatechuate 3,4-dioxygenase beta subunit|nr:intradiol ring-cleavage dioxygenase [Gemmatimonadales bacterium]MCO5118730.1 intradiol ring-cleavage dioxygenase [Burkholderiaceae bacterium]MEB2319919.1 intradiol ring-cleavage dioxygenase [Pseudomonadota bacterium]
MSSGRKAGRRAILQAWFAAGVMGVAGTTLAQGRSRATELEITPSCGNDEAPTRPQTEGPFYSAGPPAKTDFRSDAPGEPMVLLGFVLGTDCRPIEGARVDLWHADADGRYDNRSFRLRGWQASDARGRFGFETIVPGLYPGRTRHFHVKVQRPGGPVLTTQLYFPDEPGNRRDFIFDARLLMEVRRVNGARIGRFDFIIG